MAAFLWLAFIDESADYNFFPIYYDCEFIVVERKNVITYKLTEFYMAKQQKFFNDFGTWDSYQGLTNVPNAPIEFRRSNMNKTLLKVNVPKVGLAYTLSVY